MNQKRSMLRTALNNHRQILDSVERALIDTISTQVLAIYAQIGFGPSVLVEMYVDNILPESERALLSIAVEEILIGPPRVIDVELHVIDHAQHPVIGRGHCIFSRRRPPTSNDN
jgi:hypothetical protein